MKKNFQAVNLMQKWCIELHMPPALANTNQFHFNLISFITMPPTDWIELDKRKTLPLNPLLLR
jgi:hypothetical protein